MNKVRKNAYRNLLYRATIDIRALCQSRGAASRNPFEWYRQYHRSRVAGAIADWLHNLAYYAARNFKGFQEEQFWEEYEWMKKRFPNSGIECYQQSFNRFLSDQTILW
jgi:hypothetical protein